MDTLKKMPTVDAVPVMTYPQVDGLTPTVVATPDKVPVVRCKDCKYWERKDGLVIGYCGAAKHGYHSTNWDIGIYRLTMDTGYCSDGERKDDGENRENDI